MTEVPMEPGVIGDAGQRLAFAVRLGSRSLEGATAAFWRQRDLARRFELYLLTIYGSVRATLPLMVAAEQRCEELGGDDPVARRLAPYYRKHREEEQDHEEWLLDDMASIGIDASRVAGFVTPGSVASLVGAQYYWIRHDHPVALLGFFGVLEGNPPRRDDLAEIQRRTRLPDSAFRMLREHAELDQAHGEEVFELLDELPLTPRLESLVRRSALQTIRGLGQLFEGLAMQAAAPRSA